MNKNEKFKELAEKRVNRLLNDIRLVGNLANKNNYSYSSDEAQKIISVIDKEIKALKAKFLHDIGKGKFRL